MADSNLPATDENHPCSDQEAYCFNCARVVGIEDAAQGTSRGGHDVIIGKCSECANPVTKVLPRDG